MKHCGLSLVVEIPGMEFVTGAVFLLQDTVYAKFSDYSQRAIETTHQKFTKSYRNDRTLPFPSWLHAIVSSLPDCRCCLLFLKGTSQLPASGRQRRVDFTHLKAVSAPYPRRPKREDQF